MKKQVNESQSMEVLKLYIKMTHSLFLHGCIPSISSSSSEVRASKIKSVCASEDLFRVRGWRVEKNSSR